MDALRHAGYVEGKNLDIDFRAAGVADDRLDTAMGRLSRSKVDVIVAAGTSAAVAAARKATRSTPIVIAVSGDAAEAGFVGGLARPAAM